MGNMFLKNIREAIEEIFLGKMDDDVTDMVTTISTEPKIKYVHKTKKLSISSGFGVGIESITIEELLECVKKAEMLDAFIDILPEIRELYTSRFKPDKT